MPNSNSKTSLNGVLLVDKPRGMTSHDVVDRVRRIAGLRRVGHTGTLDPMADGLLVLCLGRATRIAQFLTGLQKEYSGTIKLGAISSTYDAEGTITSQGRALPTGSREIEAAMQMQRGLRSQLAPPYSAVKVRGRKLYEYARAGEEVPRKSRQVQIFEFELIDYREPEVRFYAHVGSGTYVRSMAHDLGVQLECGAFLASLRRESVGDFRIEAALELAELIRYPELVAENLLGLGEALAHMPRITVSEAIERRLLNGHGFGADEILLCENLPRPAERSIVCNAGGEVLSIVEAEARGDGPVARPNEEEDLRRLYFRPVRVLGGD